MKRAPLLLAAATLALAGAALAGRGPCEAELDVCLKQMGRNLEAKGWVGIELDVEEEGPLRITRVVPESPAAAAGLAAGDRILALNGVTYAKADRPALKAAYKAMTPGNTITYTVDRGGRKLEIDVRLSQVPEHVRAQWIAQHLVEGHSKPHHAEAGKPGG